MVRGPGYVSGMNDNSKQSLGRYAWFGPAVGGVALYGIIAAVVLALLPDGESSDTILGRVVVVGTLLGALSAGARIVDFYKKKPWLDLASRCLAFSALVVTGLVTVFVVFWP